MSSSSTLRRVSEEVRRRIESISKDDETYPSYFLNKSKWTELGDLHKIAETPKTPRVPGRKWMTLRLDGTGFSKMIPKLRKAKVLEDGFSHDFAAIMRLCCQSLMKKFCATHGYTQSDELAVLIPPASVVRGVQQEHAYNGRVMKICSTAASYCTAVFNRGIAQIMRRNKMNELLPIECWPTFDCRIGEYDTFGEAFSLIMWRAYDCGVNGVSDAVYQLRKAGLAGQKDASRRSTAEKLKWLSSHGKLPLPKHQTQGSLYIKVLRTIVGVDPRTGKKQPPTTRRRIEWIDGHVLRLVRDRKIEGLSRTSHRENKKDGGGEDM